MLTVYKHKKLNTEEIILSKRET